MKNKYILPVSIVCILAYDKIVVFECLVEGFLTNTILQQLQFSLSLSLCLFTDPVLFVFAGAPEYTLQRSH